MYKKKKRSCLSNIILVEIKARKINLLKKHIIVYELYIFFYFITHLIADPLTNYSDMHDNI